MEITIIILVHIIFYMYLCSVIRKQTMFNLNSKHMEEKEIKDLISRKEKEIRQLLELKEWLADEHLEKQIDIRLEDLSKLYKKLKH